MDQTEEESEEEDGQLMWKKLNNDLHTLSMKATDRTEWHQMVKYAVDTAVRCSVVGPFLWPAQRPGTRYQTTFES